VPAQTTKNGWAASSRQTGEEVSVTARGPHSPTARGGFRRQAARFRLGPCRRCVRNAHRPTGLAECGVLTKVEELAVGLDASWVDCPPANDSRTTARPWVAPSIDPDQWY